MNEILNVVFRPSVVDSWLYSEQKLNRPEQPPTVAGLKEESGSSSHSAQNFRRRPL